MACASRPRRPSFWPPLTAAAVSLLVLLLVAPTGIRTQDLQDSQYIDPRFLTLHSPVAPNTPQVSEPSLDEALNSYMRTQDPRYFQYYQQNNQQNNQHRQQQQHGAQQGGASEAGVRALLAQIDDIGSQQCTANVLAQWNFETNVNEETQLEALRAQLAYAEFQSRVRTLVSKVDAESVVDPAIRRQLKHLAVVGPAALPPDQLDRYNRLINDMLEIYNSATICAYNEPLRCGLRLEPDLQRVMGQSRDWDELQHTWLEWHRRSGAKLRDLYEQMIELSNYAARLNNFTDYAEYWMSPYESPGLRWDLEDVWEEIKPLYEQLHAYVRRKLRDLYGPEKLSRQAPIPAHVLGNMWGQSWSNVLPMTIPYPGKSFLDVTQEMNKQGYTPATIFRLAEEFYVSINMSALPPDFWAQSVLEETPARRLLCQPSAWDFCNGIDYRIKMCTRVTMQDLITAHHELAHIHYFLQYRKQPKVFRDGANPGFHEAVSEAVSLSVSTPHHLQALNLVLRSVDDVPHNINFLFAMAMDKVAFLPFALSLDLWRWDIFQGKTPRDRYNCHWWDLRERMSGVKPPVLRSETDFDPGSKYHVPANIPYVRYFVGTVLQFQLHRALCHAAAEDHASAHPNSAEPLHKCDIYRSKKAGNLLKRLMSAGSSLPWSEALYEATGDSRLDGAALREYFRPLEDWLRAENLRTQEYVGWNYDGDYCKYSIETANLQVYGGFYNGVARFESSSLGILASAFALLCMRGFS